jgi:hypothetical protein
MTNVMIARHRQIDIGVFVKTIVVNATTGRSIQGELGLRTSCKSRTSNEEYDGIRLAAALWRQEKENITGTHGDLYQSCVAKAQQERPDVRGMHDV